jgi:Flp pilus assembly pilin Flp
MQPRLECYTPDTVRHLWRRFLRDDLGQDVIEYGLLAGFIGIACLTVWISIQGHLHDLYVGYDQDVQGLWEPPNPGGGA